MTIDVPAAIAIGGVAGGLVVGAAWWLWGRRRPSAAEAGGASPPPGAASTLERAEAAEREAALVRERAALATETAAAQAARAAAEAATKEARERLASAAGLSQDEAKRRALEQLDRELAEEKGQRVAAAVAAAREEGESRARAIVCTALQRVAVGHAAERSVTAVALPDDSIKGRVIGRDGRNAKAFEAATGCDLVVDDTPCVVTISGFDPVRREVARRAMVALVADGRIQPTRIEELVTEAKRALEIELVEAGRSALLEADVGDAHPKIVALLGRLRLRTSYGQNVLLHSLEVAHLCGAMAGEMGLSPRVARRAGLLHDLGKAVDCEVEGGHAIVGGDVAKRCGEDPLIVNAIASHHEDVAQESPYAVLAQVGDAVSAARPGARTEAADKYLKRLGDLERVAASFAGVTEAYAIQAGREVRVIVDAQTVSDAAASALAREIAKSIEAELAYPGEIRVTVIRETRAVSVAR